MFIGVFNMYTSSSEEKQETEKSLHFQQNTVTVAERMNERKRIPPSPKNATNTNGAGC